MNLYGYANADPINFADPFGLSPCSDIVNSLKRQTKLFLDEYRKYMFFHKRNYSNDGHYQKVENFRTGMKNRLRMYQDQNCDDDDDSDDFKPTLEKARKFVDAPVPPPAVREDPPPGLPPISPPSPRDAAGMGMLFMLLMFVVVIA